MVSVNPTPASEGSFYLDPPPQALMALPGLGSFSTSAPQAATNTADDPATKVRKPYTITKSRESWTDPEHDKFLEALQLFDRDWKKIEAFVGSKTVIQIRSHAQKYFLKAQKSGAGEHLPPPRPKRKAAHPYPQKASKNAPGLPQASGSFQAFPVPSEPVLVRRPDSSPVIRTPVTNTAVSHPADNFVPTVDIPHSTKGDLRSSGRVSANNCCSSTDSTPRAWPMGVKPDQGNHSSSLRVLPDFAQVYGFIGSVFDPCTTNHLQKLKKMDPIDVETVLLLMRNLSVNLTSPDFEEHRRLLSSYEIDSEKKDSSGMIKTSSDDQSGVAGHCV